MCAKKNLSAKDLSEKFGFQVSEKDLEPEIDKDSRYLNQMADLSGLIAEQERTAEKNVESEPEKKPEKAAPEDLQRIKENWKNIVMQTQGMFKTFLTTAVPKYNGNTGENKLYVEFSNDLAQTCVDDPDKKQLLEDLILQMTGKTVEVEMLLKKTNMHQDLAEISVDDILKQTVHMNIVVEEEPEDE